MRFTNLAAVVGVAIAVLAPIALMGASSAQADSGIDEYAHCVGGGTEPPPPGVSPENWFPSVRVIATDFDSAVPPAQIVQRLVEMGVQPNDAVRRVQCFLVYAPR